MHQIAKSHVNLNLQFSDEFSIEVGSHQGAVLSPLLFIVVMEVLSREFKVGCLWILLYAYHLVLMAETLEYLKRKLIIWKDNIEAKRPHTTYSRWHSPTRQQQQCSDKMDLHCQTMLKNTHV